MEKIKILFFHTSPAAIVPLKNFYQENASDLEIINFLNDGILEFFRLEKTALITEIIVEGIRSAQNHYQVKACLITCSAVSRDQLNDIKSQLDIPVLKVDLPMLERTVESGEKIGVIASFPPGAKSTIATLHELAQEKNKHIQLVQIFKPEAYDALLQGNITLHDQLILEEIGKTNEECDAYVLTQVSLSHLKDRVEQRVQKPVFSSPQESLNQIRRILNL